MKEKDETPATEESIRVNDKELQQKLTDNAKKIIEIESEAKKQEGSRTVKTKVTGAIESAINYANTAKEKADDAETMISVKVKNPLSKIIKLIEDIKNHQSTTVSLRFTIPLIALPVVLLAAFQLGRAQTVCATRFTTQTGILKLLTVNAPAQETDTWAILRSFFPDFPKLTKQNELKRTNRTILITQTGTVIQVLHASTIPLYSYHNTTVLLTGQYSPCTGIITLDSKENITTE